MLRGSLLISTYLTIRFKNMIDTVKLNYFLKIKKAKNKTLFG
jgi:hypothetical protein